VRCIPSIQNFSCLIKEQSEMTSILYVTQDGITDHIGQAQIAPYLIGAAQLGHRIHIVSAEKPGREELKARYRSLFGELGIKWSFVPYANRPPLASSALVLWRMYRLACAVARRERQAVLHVRAYLPLIFAERLKREFGMKLLLDFRDFWADVGLETKPFKFVFRYLKRQEAEYLRAADQVVTLTHRAADILLDWYPDAAGGDRRNFHVVPCCADFDLFDRAKLAPAGVEARRRQLVLGDGPVLLYLGSIGSDYLVYEMFRTFKELLDLRPGATFVLLTNNPSDQVRRISDAAGVPWESIRVTSAPRQEVPEFIALADLSLVFIRPTLSKAGCSPTKLAELFASNIPVIANTGVGDLDAIIDYQRNGSVIVHDFEPATLRVALEKVLALPKEIRVAIRGNSEEFGLIEGIHRYAAIYDRLQPPAASVSPAEELAA
jgi:glycosyltransferase involved in cell wall biosynthesis